VVLLPLSPVCDQLFDWPVTVTWLAGKRTWVAKADPERFLQSRQ